ncbi:MAG: anti-sigma factor family protein [Planctomycetota bacterium]
MNCKEARSWLSPYLDSDLGATKTFDVSEHLRVCPDCAARFAAEELADRLIRERLCKDVMPDDLWLSLTQAVRAPSPRRVTLKRRAWAVAACLLFAVIGGIAFWARPSVQSAPGFVQQFAAETSGNLPFSVVDHALGTEALDAFLKESLNLAFTGVSELTAAGHTAFQVVSIIARSDAEGRAYSEVRLNCCGEPLLLVLARPSNGGWPAVVEEFSEQSLREFAGVKVGVRDFGDVRILAASRHAVDNVLAGLTRRSA